VPLLRIILAILIGFSLAVSPVAAAMANPTTTMEHCGKAGMGAMNMGTQDMGAKTTKHCPDCDKSGACLSQNCAQKCFKTAAAFILPEAIKTFDFSGQTYERSISVSIVMNAWPPPAPPPRA
jgi:hypothetical protein